MSRGLMKPSVFIVSPTLGVMKFTILVYRSLGIITTVKYLNCLIYTPTAVETRFLEKLIIFIYD